MNVGFIYSCFFGDLSKSNFGDKDDSGKWISLTAGNWKSLTTLDNFGALMAFTSLNSSSVSVSLERDLYFYNI